MSFFQLLASSIAKEVADRLGDELVQILRKRSRMNDLDVEAVGLKKELAEAQSTAEKEAVLDKVYDLINGVGRV